MSQEYVSEVCVSNCDERVGYDVVLNEIDDEKMGLTARLVVLKGEEGYGSASEVSVELTTENVVDLYHHLSDWLDEHVGEQCEDDCDEDECEEDEDECEDVDVLADAICNLTAGERKMLAERLSK